MKKPVDSLLNIPEICAQLHVSTSTIKNWVQAGILEMVDQHITCDSYKNLQDNIIGQHKLISRANKLHNSTHSQESLEKKYTKEIIWHNKMDKSYGTLLAAAYEKDLCNAHRNKEGIYYTPAPICQSLFASLPQQDYTQLRFCDPCCGTGNFLIQALASGFSASNLYAFDTDPIALEITRRRIFDLTGYLSTTCMHADFLQDPPHTTYDVIITNPPWGKKYPKPIQAHLMHKWVLHQSSDSCALFAQACLAHLGQAGYLGLLLPESFFLVKSFAQIRRHILAKTLITVTDHGKVFKGLLTSAQSFLLRNIPALPQHKVADPTSHRAQESYQKNPYHIININTRHQDTLVLDRILSHTHITLKNHATWGMGIVTGNNKKWIRNEQTPESLPIYRGKDLVNGQLKEACCYIAKDMSQMQQVASLDLYGAKSKIIYRFITPKLSFACDTKQSLILNSLNFFIPAQTLGIDHTILAQYLNWPLINWVHQKLFHTHKVLRANLELLPIYSQFLQKDSALNEEEVLVQLGIKKCPHNGYKLCSPI